jgi:hypothetical protein
MTHGSFEPQVAIRRYNDLISYRVSRGLKPVLTAFLSPRTLVDKTLENTPDDVPEGVPVGWLHWIDVEGEWQKSVLKELEEVRFAIIDVSDPTPALGWELLQCVKSQSSLDILLVGNIKTLAGRHDFLFEDLCAAVAHHAPRDEAERVVAALRPPLPYAEDFSNGIFALRFFRRLGRVRRA